MIKDFDFVSKEEGQGKKKKFPTLLFFSILIFLLGFAAGFYLYTNPDMSIISSSAVGAGLLKPKGDFVQLDATPSSNIISLTVQSQTGVEKYLFHDINPYIDSAGDRIAEAQVNTTVYNFLDDAMRNPTIGKCNIIKNYLSGTAWENLTCLELQSRFSDRIQNGWKTFNKGVESGRVEVNGTAIRINFGNNIKDGEELKIGDNSITITQSTTVFTTALNNQTRSEANFTHLSILQNGTNSPYDNLVAYWSFDKDTSVTSYDLSNNDNDGNYTNGAFANTSGVGNVYDDFAQFDGVNDVILLRNSASLDNINQNMSISLWLKTTQAACAVIAEKWAGVVGPGYAFSVRDNCATANKVSFQAYDGTNTLAVSSTTTMNDGVWRLFTATKNGFNISIYVNGVLENSTLDTVTGNTNNTQVTGIGARGNAAFPFNGSIDELMIFNKSLTATEVSAIYNNQSQRFYPQGTSEVSQFNITYPNDFNKVNLTVNGFERLLNTNVSARLGYWVYNSSTSYAQNYYYENQSAYANFDGTNDFINATDINNIKGVKELTLSLWAYQSTLGTDKTYISKWDYSTQGSFALQTDSTTNTKIRIYIANAINDIGTVHGVTTTTPLLANTWQYITMVYNGTASTNSTKLKIYVNGTEQNLTFTGQIPDTLTNATSTLKIGSFGGALTRYFNGATDEVMVFNRSLSQSEITSIYALNRTRPYNGSTTGLVSYYSFNTGSAQDDYSNNSGTSTNGVFYSEVGENGLVGYWHGDGNANDYSGKGNDGTFVNGATAKDYGVYNNSFVFNTASSQYVNVISNPTLNLTGTGFHISAWVNSRSNSNRQVIVGKDGTTRGYVLEIHATCGGVVQAGTICLVYNDGGAFPAVASASGTLPINSWNHIVGQKVGNTLELYMNGIRLTPATTTNPTKETVNFGSDPLQIGARVLNTFQDYFNGSIDEVMIFNRSLSQSEITELYVKGRAKWQYTPYQNLTSTTTNTTFSIPTNQSNILPSYQLVGNTNNFYTPYLSGTSTFDFFNAVEGDIISPIVNLLAPPNNTRTTVATHYFNSSYSDETALSTALKYVWNSSGDVINLTTKVLSGTSDSYNLSITLPYEGRFYFNDKVNDSSNNIAWNNTNFTILYDATNPSIVNLTETPSDPATYVQNQRYEFNATITDNLQLQTILFEFNGVNYTTTQSGNVFNRTIYDLAAGTYNYKWFANDSVGNFNLTLGSYTINKITSELNLTVNNLDANITIQVGSTIDINVTMISGNSGMVINLSMEGAMFNTGIAPLGNTTTFNNLGVFNFTTFYPTGQNYTASSETHFVQVVDTTNPVVNLDSPANATSTTSLSQNYSANFTDNFQLKNSTLYIWNSTNHLINKTTRDVNGTSNRTVISVTLPYDGTFKWNYYGCDTSSNCAFNVTNRTIIIDATAPGINYTAPLNDTGHTAGIDTITAETLPSESVVWYYRVNGAAWVSAGTGTSMSQGYTFAAGTYNITVNATDTLGNQAVFTEYEVVYSASGGGSICGVTASVTRINATHIQFGASSWDSSGAKTTYTLTGLCRNSAGQTITFPTFSTLATGTYEAIYNTSVGGTCEIRASGQSCTPSNVAWYSYFGNQTSSSSTACNTNSSIIKVSPAATKPYVQLCKALQF